jgi:hypothetical protein
MQAFLSILPFLILLASIGCIIFIGANVFLIRDLRQMQREHLEGVLSIWYQRSRVQGSLKWMGYGLVVVLLAFGWGTITFLPRDIAIISMLSLIFVALSITVVIASSRLLRDLRNLSWERKEGFPLVWHRQPKVLIRIGQILFLFGPLLDLAYAEYSLLAHDIFHQPLSENTAPLIIIPGVFFLFAVAFYFYAILLEVLKSRSY